MDLESPLTNAEFSSFPVWNIRYRTGRTSRVRMVDERIPPITTVAKGRCTSAPVPLAKAMGTNPKDATRAVINTGLSLLLDPVRIASSKGTPSERKDRMEEIMTRPLSTATPDSAMNPTPAEMESGIPRNQRATTPPVNAKGTPVNTSQASFMEPKVV